MVLFSMPALAAPIESFPTFLRNFEDKAVAAGVSRDVYRAATRGLTPDPNVPDLVETQPEFTTPVWDYIDARVTARRIERGRASFEDNREIFAAVGKRYGVDPYLLAAIWGIETDYGSVLGNPKYIRPIVRSLATLVHQRRSRLRLDEADFIAALLLVQRGPLDADHLVGSWAGAIGHLQVNPSNVIAHGTDGDGDGRIDLHNSLADALATSAKFLLDVGYVPGVDWGYEVRVPDGFDYLLADRERLRPISFFTARGIRRIKGQPFANEDEPVFLYVPAGRDGPTFLMTRNYLALKGYNFSDSYAMSVAHLTDRLKGAGTFIADWPRDATFPNLHQRMAIQDALVKLGYLTGTSDGRLGPITQAAYARFQASRGEVADGFITIEAYRALTGQ
jgi:membrane-bound lytic murein transglycosylase B